MNAIFFATLYLPNFTYNNSHSEQVQVSFYFPKELKKAEENSLIPYRSVLLKPNQSIEVNLPEAGLELRVYNAEGKLLESERVEPS